jgi:hypothetical protein
LGICPYFPFNVSVWLNGHNWLACQLRREGLALKTCDNLFVACAQPQRLQELSDAFAPSDRVTTVETWLDRLLPYFSPAEREQGYRHQLFLAQMEYCHNLLFQKPAGLDRLFDRLRDANRGIGHPDKRAVVFGRARYQPDMRTGQTALRLTKLRLPVISSSFKQTLIKHYVKQGAGLRTESSTFQLKDLSLPKNIKNLAKVREALDRGQHKQCSQNSLRKRAQNSNFWPTETSNTRSARTPSTTNYVFICAEKLVERARFVATAYSRFGNPIAKEPCVSLSR